MTPEYVGDMRGLGFRDLSADDAVAFRIHGVTPEFVREMGDLGFPDLSADDVVAFRIHGVDPGFVRELRGLGYTTLSADDLTDFRITRGLTPEAIRDMNARAGRRLSPDDLIERRIHGDDGRLSMMTLRLPRPAAISAAIILWATLAPSPAPAVPPAGGIGGRWLIDFDRDGSVQLTLKRRENGHGSWNSSDDYRREDFQGLTVPAGSVDVPARFALSRDAGTITFEGMLNDAGGSGHFTFAPARSIWRP